MRKKCLIKIVSLSALICHPAFAQIDSDAIPDQNNQPRYSTNLHGMLGLNSIPSARMDKTGTVRAQLAHLDPYIHAFFGMQLADPLYVGIRQSAEFSSLSDDAKRLYPGLDAKLRIVKEASHIPEIAIGLQSGLGHKRQSGEYIAASKRYKNFDFTAGIGWGRFAGAAHIDNPLKAISNHFKKERGLNDENPNKPEHWFTGDNIGFFAGLEYFTPLKGLSLKADIGGDNYTAESAAFNFDAAAPWSVGINYKPYDFVDLGLAAQGTDKIMARLALQANVKNLPHQSRHISEVKPLSPHRTQISLADKMRIDAEQEHINLQELTTTQNSASTLLPLSPYHASPSQLMRAAKHIANNAGPTIEEINITPISRGLRGPSISLMRGSLENALAHNNGSIDEIWRTSEIKHNFRGLQKMHPVSDKPFSFKNLSVTLDNQFSLSEEETSILRRTSLIAETQGALTGFSHLKYLQGGLGLRINISDNIGKIRRLRPQALTPIRSDPYEFTEDIVALDNAFLALTHTIASNWHTSAIIGYPEEMFAGLGGEILYRPFDKRFAVGADSWIAYKRDTSSFGNLDVRPGANITTHINGWYDIPKADITIGGKLGYYLAGDFGTSLNLTKNFKNGAKLEGYVSLSEVADPDPFGGTTHADHGLRLTLPFGGFGKVGNTEIKTTIAPFGRDIGQFIQNPLPLYKITEPFSLSHITHHWEEIKQ